MRNRATRAALICGLLLSFACSSSTPTSDGGNGDGGPTPDQACADQAAAQCQLLDTCEPNFGLSHLYGTQAVCLQRFKTSCLLNQNAPGVTRSTAQLETCVAAENQESCSDYFVNNPPAACNVAPGTKSNGASCSNSLQCASQYCAVPTIGAICGTCQTAPAPGASCATLPCGHDQLCSRESQTCTTPIGTGNACSDPNVCAPGLTCFGLDAGGQPGTCIDAGVLGTTPCDGRNLDAPNCNSRVGLFCAAATTCDQQLLVAAGSTCGEIDAGPRPCPDGGSLCIVNEQILCQGGAACIENNGTASCVAPAADGAACDVIQGPACLPPAKCLVSGAGTSGTCTIPDPTLCP